jgi:predicted glycosyltransferase
MVRSLRRVRVWVDCTAAAHPLVLRPIIERLQGDGHEVEVTARDYGQTEGILERLGIPFTSIGAHGGGSMFGKGRALAGRSGRLWRWAGSRDFDLALAHGSVDIAVVSRLRRIPLVQMNDYEHAGLQRRISFRGARLVLAPDAIPVEAMERAGARQDRLFRYPGLKEDYYLSDFEPDSGVLEELAIDGEGLLAVVRPPPETSEYHRQNPLYEGVIDRLAAEATTVVVPRTEEQAARLRERGAGPTAADGRRLVVPERAIDAQSLIAYADLVVSAGGTMNREAVALGTPVYTIFSGEMGAVDDRLIAEGRLRPLENPADLKFEKRQGGTGPVHPRDPKLLTDAVLSAATG